MKNKRTLIVSLLLVVALCVGIGYAAFSSRMAINGEAILPGVDESKVVFTDAVKTAGNDNVTISVEGQNSKSLTVDVVGFTAVGESATITATISNPHPFEVTLTTPSVVFTDAEGNQTATSDYFDIVLVGTAPASIDAATGATPATTSLVFQVTAKQITASATTQNFIISLNSEAA